MLDWYGALGVDKLYMLNCGDALGLKLKLCMLAWYGANGAAEATLILVLLVYKQEIHTH